MVVPVRGSGHRAGDRLHQQAHQSSGVAARVATAHPGSGDPCAVERLAQCGRLAVAGTGNQEHRALLECRSDACPDARTLDQATPGRREHAAKISPERAAVNRRGRVDGCERSVSAASYRRGHGGLSHVHRPHHGFTPAGDRGGRARAPPCGGGRPGGRGRSNRKLAQASAGQPGGGGWESTA